MMEYLLDLMPFVSENWYEVVFSTAIFANPFLAANQAYKAWTAPSTEGLSWMTFLGMVMLQMISTGYAIHLQHQAMFLAMFFSSLFTLATALAAIIRPILKKYSK